MNIEFLVCSYQDHLNFILSLSAFSVSLVIGKIFLNAFIAWRKQSNKPFKDFTRSRQTRRESLIASSDCVPKCELLFCF